MYLNKRLLISDYLRCEVYEKSHVDLDIVMNMLFIITHQGRLSVKKIFCIFITQQQYNTTIFKHQNNNKSTLSLEPY